MKLNNIAKRTSARRVRGQGLSEYLIIVGLVAVGSITVIGLFGDTVDAQVASVATALTGADSDSTAAAGQAASAVTAAAANNNLSTFDGAP